MLKCDHGRRRTLVLLVNFFDNADVFKNFGVSRFDIRPDFHNLAQKAQVLFGDAGDGTHPFCVCEPLAMAFQDVLDAREGLKKGLVCLVYLC